MRNLTVKRLVWVGIITSAIVITTTIPVHFWEVDLPQPQAIEDIWGEILEVLRLVPAAAFTAALAAVAVRHYLALLIEHTPGRFGLARPARQFIWAIAATATAIAVEVLSAFLYYFLTLNQQSSDYSGPLALQEVLGSVASILFAAAGVFLTIGFILSVLARESRRVYPIDAESATDGVPIRLWWPRLSPASRKWLIANNGEAVPRDIVRLIVAAGGTVHHEPSETAVATDEAFLADEELEWIGGVASGETRW